MKVILLRDVAKMGRRGTIIDVPDGYAYNKLLPQKMAKPATAENMKQVSEAVQKRAQASTEDKSAFRELVAVLSKEPLTIEVEANAQGHMFQALKASALSEAIKVHTGRLLEEKHITFSSPIKSTGQHSVSLVWDDIKSDITIEVVAKHT